MKATIACVLTPSLYATVTPGTAAPRLFGDPPGENLHSAKRPRTFTDAGAQNLIARMSPIPGSKAGALDFGDTGVCETTSAWRTKSSL
jgi:hypothetical protein